MAQNRNNVLHLRFTLILYAQTKSLPDRHKSRNATLKHEALYVLYRYLVYALFESVGRAYSLFLLLRLYFKARLTSTFSSNLNIKSLCIYVRLMVKIYICKTSRQQVSGRNMNKSNIN